nr:E3 ubiquitin-protein ligase TRIM41-like isoform X2 [Pelodiscus sinensis]|eukprot:XP_025039018.1 E3 ubiquitin-protein ligase TRIM41-like isoform X2 [Pelodiscus sinensis]
MAAATPAREIQEESKCPICQDSLTAPVRINCGHSFCRGCITRHRETQGEPGSDPLSCPSCRTQIQKGALRSNQQLTNIVEKLRQLNVSPGKEDLCGRHGKALDLFCREDWEAVCAVCWKSPEHKSHTALSLDEAAQTHKEKLQAHLETLREQREKLLGLKMTREKRCQAGLVGACCSLSAGEMELGGLFIVSLLCGLGECGYGRNSPFSWDSMCAHN